MGNLVARTISDLSRGHIMSYHHHITLYPITSYQSYIISYNVFTYHLVFFPLLSTSDFQDGTSALG